MKKFLLAFTMLIASSASAMTLPITGLIDGDTVRTFLPIECPLCEGSVRVYGIDTPESSMRYAKCEKEVALGLQATEFVRALIGKNTIMEVTNVDWDKYGGRVLGNVSVGGKDIATELINAGLAAPYYGVGTKKDWCQ